MIVVADTSPINYLLLINQIDLLPFLFQKIIGTLGILDAAATQGRIDLAETLAQLQQTNFRASRRIIQALLSQPKT